jgi:hypothetical protein
MGDARGRAVRAWSAILVSGICALALSACATAPKPAGAARPGQEDLALGLIGPETPELLREVSARPYAVPEPRSCQEIERQIVELDGLLGPDVDSGSAGGEDHIAAWARGAVRGLVPYRSVVRFLTGAPGRERELASAVLAGAARRGYLKGVRETLPCPVPPPPSR